LGNSWRSEKNRTRVDFFAPSVNALSRASAGARLPCRAVNFMCRMTSLIVS
jgi:hypothetical protein